MNSQDTFSELRDARILVVDDDPEVHSIVAGMLVDENVTVSVAESITAAKIIAGQQKFDAAVIDMKIADENGLDLVSHFKRILPEVPLVVITGFADREMAHNLEHAGINSVLTKPFSSSQLKFTLCKELVRRNTALSEGVVGADGSTVCELGFAGSSSYINDLRSHVRLVAQSDVPVLIQGPTGTGKEIIARAIHANSRRKARQMIIVNSSAIPEPLEESEFFGHVKGAFTGASDTKDGIIACADQSTLFLDEVGELSRRIQAKLLRVLDGHEFNRVGETVPRSSDFRLVSATNRDLHQMIKAGTFREDLFYRLKSAMIVTRPLLGHREDIPDLVRHFLARVEEKENRKYLVAGGALDLLMDYEWPGNIRELRNMVSTLCAGSVQSGFINRESVEWLVVGKRKESAKKGAPYSEAKLEFEKNYFQCLLYKHNGNITKVAREAEVERSYLSKRLKSFGIQIAEFRDPAQVV